MSAKGKYSEDKFEDVPIEVLEEYLRTGDEKLFTPKIRLYADQLNLVRQAIERYSTENEILRLLDVTYPGMDVRARKQIYIDCCNFYYADEKIKKAAWRNIIARKYQAVFALAIARSTDSSLDVAMRAAEKEANLRECHIQDKPVEGPDPLRTDTRPVIVTADPNLLGMGEINRDEVLREVSRFTLSKAERKIVESELDHNAPMPQFNEAEE